MSIRRFVLAALCLSSTSVLAAEPSAALTPPDFPLAANTVAVAPAGAPIPVVRVRPTTPAALSALDVGELSCSVHLTLGANGAPTVVDLAGCPVIVRDAAADAAAGWRFRNVPETGAQFDLTFVFAAR